MRAALEEGPATAREISERAGISEKDVVVHLSHLLQSARHRRERVVIESARCVGCGFAFEARDRLSKPGRCPRCRSTRIAPARFSIEPG